MAGSLTRRPLSRRGNTKSMLSTELKENLIVQKMGVVKTEESKKKKKLTMMNKF